MMKSLNNVEVKLDSHRYSSFFLQKILIQSFFIQHEVDVGLGLRTTPLNIFLLNIPFKVQAKP